MFQIILQIAIENPLIIAVMFAGLGVAICGTVSAVETASRERSRRARRGY